MLIAPAMYKGRRYYRGADLGISGNHNQGGGSDYAQHITTLYTTPPLGFSELPTAMCIAHAAVFVLTKRNTWMHYTDYARIMRIFCLLR